MVNINEETIRETIDLTLEDAYKRFCVYKIDNKELEKSYQQIRWGIKIKFDIYTHFKNKIINKEKEGVVIIEGKSYANKDYYTELEEREALIKKEILEHVSVPNKIKGRGEK